MIVLVDGNTHFLARDRAILHFLRFGLKAAMVRTESEISVSYSFMNNVESYVYRRQDDEVTFSVVARIADHYLHQSEESRSAVRALLLAFGVDSEVELESAAYLDLPSVLEILENPEFGSISDWVTEADRERFRAAKAQREANVQGLLLLAAENRSARPIITDAIRSGVLVLC